MHIIIFVTIVILIIAICAVATWYRGKRMETYTSSSKDPMYSPQRYRLDPNYGYAMDYYNATFATAMTP